MGIQLCYNGYGWNPSTAHAAATPSNLYYYCHLRGQIWPLWSLDLSQACVPLPSGRGVGRGWGEGRFNSCSFHRDEFTRDIFAHAF